MWLPKLHEQNAMLIKKQRKNKLAPRMTSLLQTSWPSLFTGAFFSVFSSVLVQLCFDDIKCFCGFELR